MRLLPGRPEQTLSRELQQISETNGRIVEATERLDALGEPEAGRKPGDVKLIVTPLPLVRTALSLSLYLCVCMYF